MIYIKSKRYRKEKNERKKMEKKQIKKRKKKKEKAIYVQEAWKKYEIVLINI